MTIKLTPNSITWESGTVEEVSDPIGTAASIFCDRVEMSEGVYPTPSYFKHIHPLEFVGIGDPYKIRIRRGSGATLYLTNPAECRDVAFRNMTIEAGPTAAVLTDGKTAKEIPNKDDRYYQRLAFIGCKIDGGFSHVTQTGVQSKWGMRLHQCTGLVVQDCSFGGIRWEHGLYATQLGWIDSLIADCLFENLGRCAVQVGHRQFENDGEMGQCELRIRNCRVEQHGLVDGGGAFTISGMRGNVWIQDSHVECSPKGNGLVSWAEHDPDNKDYPKPGSPNAGLAIVGSSFVGNDCERPIIQIAGTDEVYMFSGSVSRGANPVAVWLNGKKYGMGGQAFPIKRLRRSLTQFKVDGRVEWDGTTEELLP